MVHLPWPLVRLRCDLSIQRGLDCKDQSLEEICLAINI
jgi:hypothetical protein